MRSAPTRAPRRARLAFLAIVAAVACHRVPHAAPAPRILGVSPSSIVIRSGTNAVLTISGSDFVADSNTVSFGPYSFDGIPSAEGGTMISVNIPDRMPTSGGAAPMLWVAADYLVRVSNRNGRSATISIALTVQP